MPFLLVLKVEGIFCAGVSCKEKGYSLEIRGSVAAFGQTSLLKSHIRVFRGEFVLKTGQFSLYNEA